MSDEMTHVDRLRRAAWIIAVHGAQLRREREVTGLSLEQVAAVYTRGKVIGISVARLESIESAPMPSRVLIERHRTAVEAAVSAFAGEDDESRKLSFPSNVDEV